MSEPLTAAPAIAPPAPVETNRASDYLEATTTAPTETLPSNGETPSPPAEPAAPVEETAAATPPSSLSEEAKPAPTPGDVKLAARLASIAKASRKIELAQKELESRQRDFEVKRKSLERYEKADAASTRLDKLRAIAGGDDAELEAYFWELNAHTLDRAKPKTQEDVLRLAEDRAVARVKSEAAAAEEARAKAAKASYDESKATAERAYLDRARGAIDAVADAVPSVMRGLASGRVTERDILDYVEAEFSATGKVVPPEDVLKAFEAHLSPSKKPAQAVEAPQAAPSKPSTITSKMMGNAPLTRWEREMTQQQSWEEAKRAAGILK